MLQLFPFGHIFLAFMKLVVRFPSASWSFCASVAHFGETEQFVWLQGMKENGWHNNDMQQVVSRYSNADLYL